MYISMVVETMLPFLVLQLVANMLLLAHTWREVIFFTNNLPWQMSKGKMRGFKQFYSIGLKSYEGKTGKIPGKMI